MKKVQVSGEAIDSYKPQTPVSTKYTQPMLDTARTITVIPRAIMEDRSADSLRDVLRNVSGITMEAGEGGAPTGDALTIRGFSARNDILIDGVRDIAGYDRDVFNVESVEVAKGPGSAIYGRGSTGGTINLQTKRANRDDFGVVGLRLGTEEDYRATLDINRAIGETSGMRVNVLSNDGEVAGRDEVERSKNALAVAFAAGLGTETRLIVNADYQKQDNLPDYGLPWVPNGSAPVSELADRVGKTPKVDFSNFYGNVYRDFEDIEAQSLTARVEHDLGTDTMLRLQARTGTVERQSIVSAPRFANVETGTDVRLSDEKTRDTEDSMAIVQLDLVGHYNAGSVGHDIVAGIEVARERFKRWNYVDLVDDNLDSTPELVDLYNPNPRVPYSGDYGRDGTDQKAEGDTAAIYLFDTMTLSPQWELTLGLRWDRFETEYRYDYEDPSLKLEATNRELSWNTGLVYKPASNGSVYIAAGTSFTPSADDLTANANGNNADLDPEETVSYELGTKWEVAGGSLLLGAAIFRTEKQHARTDDPFAEDDANETLDGKQRVDGLELNAAGQIGERLSLFAAYTYQDSEVVDAGGEDVIQEGYELARTPEHSFSLWSLYQVSDRWTAGFGGEYVGKRYNSSDPTGREQADDYVTFDMMVACQVTDQLELQLNGTNLTDEEYVDRPGGGHFIPGEARRFSLSANYVF